jgi:hypothetical protein
VRRRRTLPLASSKESSFPRPLRHTFVRSRPRGGGFTAAGCVAVRDAVHDCKGGEGPFGILPLVRFGMGYFFVWFRETCDGLRGLETHVMVDASLAMGFASFCGFLLLSFVWFAAILQLSCKRCENDFARRVLFVCLRTHPACKSRWINLKMRIVGMDSSIHPK